MQHSRVLNTVRLASNNNITAARLDYELFQSHTFSTSHSNIIIWTQQRHTSSQPQIEANKQGIHLHNSHFPRNIQYPPLQSPQIRILVNASGCFVRELVQYVDLLSDFTAAVEPAVLWWQPREEYAVSVDANRVRRSVQMVLERMSWRGIRGDTRQVQVHHDGREYEKGLTYEIEWVCGPLIAALALRLPPLVHSLDLVDCPPGSWLLLVWSISKSEGVDVLFLPFWRVVEVIICSSMVWCGDARCSRLLCEK